MKTITVYWWVFVIVFVLAGIFFFQYRALKKSEDRIQLKEVELATLKGEVSSFKNKNDALTFKVHSVQVEKDNLKKSLEVAGIDIKELKSRDIKWREITSALQAELESSGHGETFIYDTVYINKTDTIRAGAFKWDNDYLFLNGKITNKKLDFQYKYKTDIKLISTGKGKETVVSAFFTDTNAEMLNANSITIKPVSRWWNKWYVYTFAGFAGGYFLSK